MSRFICQRTFLWWEGWRLLFSLYGEKYIKRTKIASLLLEINQKVVAALLLKVTCWGIRRSRSSRREALGCEMEIMTPHSVPWGKLIEATWQELAHGISSLLRTPGQQLCQPSGKLTSGPCV